MSADTSREAVERLAALWEASSWAGGGFTHTRAAATLRVLLAERDAARADVARVREALAKLADDARYYCDHGPVAGWLPRMKDIRDTVRAALAGTKPD